MSSSSSVFNLGFLGFWLFLSFYPSGRICDAKVLDKDNDVATDVTCEWDTNTNISHSDIVYTKTSPGESTTNRTSPYLIIPSIKCDKENGKFQGHIKTVWAFKNDTNLPNTVLVQLSLSTLRDANSKAEPTIIASWGTQLQLISMSQNCSKLPSKDLEMTEVECRVEKKLDNATEEMASFEFDASALPLAECPQFFPKLYFHVSRCQNSETGYEDDDESSGKNYIPVEKPTSGYSLWLDCVLVMLFLVSSLVTAYSCYKRAERAVEASHEGSNSS